MIVPREQQFELLQSEVVFAKLSARTRIEVRGEDRTTFLHNLCTNDIRALVPGTGCEAYFTTVQGKTLLHTQLFCEGDKLVIDASGGYAETILPHLEKYLIREDVTLSDTSADWRPLWLAGPEAEGELSKLHVAVPTDMLSHTVADLAGGAVRVCRVPFAHAPCFLLQVLDADVASLIDVMTNAKIAEVESDVVEYARIAAAYPDFGRDASADNLPQELNRNQQAISFTKGCYLGQETVARIDALGHVNRYLVPLEFTATSGAPPAGTELTGEGKVVGSVTSSVWLRSTQAARAPGFVKRQAIESHLQLSSDFGPVRIVSDAN